MQYISQMYKEFRLIRAKPLNKCAEIRFIDIKSLDILTHLPLIHIFIVIPYNKPQRFCVVGNV